MKPGLIAIQKQVTRSDTGRAHEQRYWTRPEDIRKAVSDGKTDEVISSLGGDPERAKEFVYGWQSGTTRPKALEFRLGVSKVFGSNIDDDMRRMGSIRAWKVDKSLPDSVVSRMAEDVRRDIDQVRESEGTFAATVKAMAQASQAMYDTETVTLYRGIRGKQAQELLRAKAEGRPAQVQIDHASSWSDDQGCGEKFANYWNNGNAAIRVTVPRSAIAWSWRIFGEEGATNQYSHDYEREVVLHSDTGVFTVQPDDITER